MKIAIGIVVALVIIIAGYFLFARSAAAPVQNPRTVETGNSAPLETTNPAAGTVETGSPNAAGMGAAGEQAVKVTYDGTSFSPASVTVKKGQSVTFVNTSGSPMWVASNPHPTHQGYSGTTASQHCPDTAGTAFDECSAGTTYTFTFGKVGSWGYHNHANHGATGTVVVTE